MKRRALRAARPAPALIGVGVLVVAVGCTFNETRDPDASAKAYRDMREVKGSPSMFSPPEPSVRRGQIPEGR